VSESVKFSKSEIFGESYLRASVIMREVYRVLIGFVLKQFFCFFTLTFS
jgi:hypothetical protein